jgi:hypothetical protein
LSKWSMLLTFTFGASRAENGKVSVSCAALLAV